MVTGREPVRNCSSHTLVEKFLVCHTLVNAGSKRRIVCNKKQLNKKEEKLKWQLNEHENKLNEEKIKFLINISHELRTPLTLIYTPLKRLIEKKVTPENAETELKNIFKQTKQMKQVIDMVLDVRKMELGKEELHFSKHNINPWLTEVADAFVPEFKEKEIRVTFDLDESLGEIIFDENKSSIVLSNLLMNALKFSPVNSTVTIRSRRNGDHVRVESPTRYGTRRCGYQSVVFSLLPR